MDRQGLSGMEKKARLSWLLAFYEGVLTEKQKQVLRLSCAEDMSLQEIADETGVTRQNVHEILSRTSDKLFRLEAELHLAERFRVMQEKLEACHAALTGNDTALALKILEEIIRVNQEDTDGL